MKNSDELLGDGSRESNKSYIEDIVTDPGIGGALPSNQIFVGWYIGETKDYTTKTDPMTIEQIRSYLADLSITDGDTVKVWAMIFKVFSVTYFDESNISMGTDEVYALLNEEKVNYKVSKSYTPVDPTKNFEGWITDNDANISDATLNGVVAEEPYKLGTEMTISGNIVFTVSAPKGRWLVFDENGKGATYNAPQFVKDGEKTTQPKLAMTRLGYTFVGWYTEKYGDADTPDPSKEFSFGQELAEPSTTIYAKWSPAEKADYTVIYWKQNVSGDGYDFDRSATINGNVGTEIKVTSSDSTINVTGAPNYSIEKGFKYGHNDTGKSVAAEGNTVVNVYIDRIEYTLTFIDESGSNSNITYVYSGRTYSDAPVGDEITNSTNINTLETNKRTISGYDVSRYGNQGNRTYAIKINDKWYKISSEGQYVWDASSISSVPSGSGGVVKTITALYQQNISDQFPIVGTNGTTYDNGERWMPGTNSLNWNKVMVYIETMPNDNVTFTLDTATRPLKTMNYYVEALPSDTATITHKGTKYVLYNSINARYNGVTSEDFVDLDGFEKVEATTSINGTALTPDSSDFYIYDQYNNETINFFYSRLKYNINFMDGRYFDGNNNPLSEYESTGQWKVDKELIYGVSTASYNKDGEKYFVPESKYPGFIFEGWYIDDACTSPYTFTTLPKGGITVYAKWRQVQYRVFMHPNATLPDGTNDSSLNWGDTQEKPQEMNFRISYQGQVSMPTGTRDDYEFIGWFLDEATTDPFNTDSKLTDDLVKTEYDKNDPDNYTDKMNKFGEIEGDGWNSDLTGNNGSDRFWITHKLDLYGKWSAILTGAEGIGIIYDANGGSGAPNDIHKYKDNVNAIAQAASTPSNTKTQQFLYWVVQKWDKSQSKYIDTSTRVYPGAAFTVLKANAKETDLNVGDEDYEEGKVFKAYTIQLRAEYGPKEPSNDTHITWYANNGTESSVTDEGLQINEAVSIRPADTFKYAGHIFIGWAKEADATENNLFLKYEDNVFKAKDADGNWVEVTEVAADEKQPYENLYAIWKEAFYVFHSSDGKVDVYTESDLNNGKFNIQSKVKAGYLYGGYYTSYLNLTDADAIAVAGTDEAATTALYDGTALNQTIDGATVRYWRKADAYGTTPKSDKLGGGPGNEMQPKYGVVYYLKEVPNKYLSTNMQYLYNLNTKDVTKLYLISTIDDSYYSNVGFEVSTISDDQIGRISNSIKIQRFTGDTTTTLNANGYIGQRGYLTYITNTSLIKENTSFKVSPFWTTYDGIKVKNEDKARTFEFGDSITIDDLSEVQ